MQLLNYISILSTLSFMQSLIVIVLTHKLFSDYAEAIYNIIS